MNIEAQKNWDNSFEEQIETNSYNTAPVEAIIRTISYYLSQHSSNDYRKLRFRIGKWWCKFRLASTKGIRVSGIDISKLHRSGRNNLKLSGYENFIDQLVQGSVAKTPFASNSFDGALEACVFQHLNKQERKNAFKEVHRVLKLEEYLLDIC